MNSDQTGAKNTVMADRMNQSKRLLRRNYNLDSYTHQLKAALKLAFPIQTGPKSVFCFSFHKRLLEGSIKNKNAAKGFFLRKLSKPLRTKNNSRSCARKA